jgi:hypothetical protein
VRGASQQRTLFLAGWVLLWTSLAPEILSADTVLVLYRTRWQVELAIQRWQSRLDVDALRARQGSPLAELWLHGKLLYALLVDKRMRRIMGDLWVWLDQERTATWWRPWKLLHAAVAPQISGALHGPSSAGRVLAGRPSVRGDAICRVPCCGLSALTD